MSDSDFDWYFENVVVPEAARSRDGLTKHRRWAVTLDNAASSVELQAAVDVARRQGTVLTHEQARAAGLSAADLRRLVRRGTWTAPRRNVLCVLPSPADEDNDVHGTRHEVLAAAAALVIDSGVVSHESAGVVQGIDVLREPVRPILTVSTGNGGGRHDVLVHLAELGAIDMQTWFGTALTTPARTVVDIARNSGAGAGLVAADSALRADLVTRAELRDAAARATRWPGVVTARRVVELASPRAESPLESLTRLLIDDWGLPIPELQILVRTSRRAYRVDGLWRDRRVVLEVDGMLKYREPPALVNEKRRQEDLERAGYRVVRVTWEDIYARPSETIARITNALRRGGRRI